MYQMMQKMIKPQHDKYRIYFKCFNCSNLVYTYIIRESTYIWDYEICSPFMPTLYADYFHLINPLPGFLHTTRNHYDVNHPWSNAPAFIHGCLPGPSTSTKCGCGISRRSWWCYYDVLKCWIIFRWHAGHEYGDDGTTHAPHVGGHSHACRLGHMVPVFDVWCLMFDNFLFTMMVW